MSNHSVFSNIGAAWLLLAAAASLAVFVWLLTLHPVTSTTQPIVPYTLPHPLHGILLSTEPT